MQRILIYLVAVIILGACSPKSAHKIEGTISDAANLNVYFDQISLTGNTKVLQNTQADPTGHFTFTFEEPLQTGIYRTRVGAKSAILVLDPEAKNIEISGNMASLGDNSYSLTGNGAEESELLRSKIQSLSQAGRTVNSDEVVTSGPNAIVNAFLANQVFRASPSKLAAYETIQAQLNQQYPNSEPAQEMTTIVDGIKASMAAQKGRYKFDVGDVAPEIAMHDLDGNIRKLSDLQGKVVLIDFWASWCGPCRKANPHVVEIYDKYNKEGFEVYSVSLDGIHPKVMERYAGDEAKIKEGKEQAKDKWEKAIAADNLKWENHVSELDHWGSEVNKVYGVSSIPTTFLVGRDGKFAAINPRYNLEEAVKAAL